MRKITLFSVVGWICLAACGQPDSTESDAEGRAAWVTADRLHRRTCPNSSCGSVGVLFFREKATVYEEKAGWARISKYYDASCENGRSEYVDSGNARCESANGIVEGKFAEWVAVQHLSSTSPSDPAAGATGDYALVSGSDDYRLHKDAFARAAAELITSGRCRRADFEEMGGWMKSTTHRNRPVYFTYCGGMHLRNKLYLDASTGRIWSEATQ